MEDDNKCIDSLLITLNYLKENGALDIKPGKQIEFKCMHCDGRAIASRAMSNGHLWVVCYNCGVLLFQ